MMAPLQKVIRQGAPSVALELQLAVRLTPVKRVPQGSKTVRAYQTEVLVRMVHPRWQFTLVASVAALSGTLDASPTADCY
jgi:hypothetical protein